MNQEWKNAPSEMKLSQGTKELIIPLGSDKTASIFCQEEDIPQLEKMLRINK